MKCFHCDGEYQEIIEDYKTMLKMGEEILLKDIVHHCCDTCNSKVFSPDSVKKMEEEIERIYPNYYKKKKKR